ncbi:MAG TPA: SDR family NAD(P)-dependent oxidoreductase [Phototrophicaceae bacterium]|nr:SDR family NAD(P)-dependent oxidoreductase [Phototrophicaceae bacterium]
MDVGLKDAVVLVTGSSSGIGRAAAIAFAQEGARVAITYHSDRAGAEATAQQVEAAGGAALITPFDLADAASIKAAIATIKDKWNALHVLINNAAPANIAPTRGRLFEDVAPEQWQPVVRGVLEGAYLTVQAALPLMRASGWGRIVNLSSDGAIHGVPGLAPYSSAKAGLSGLTLTLSAELGAAHILTNSVMPGFVATESNLQIPQNYRDMIMSGTPSGHFTTPDDVARLIVFLGSQANGNVNGQTILISGGAR